MPTNYFEPVPDQPYAQCKICPNLVLSTEQDADEHMHQTMEAARAEGGTQGHRVSILNPSRPQRINREVASIIDRAITDSLDDLYDLVRRDHATEEEVTAALKWHDDFADAWQEYCNED